MLYSCTHMATVDVKGLKHCDSSPGSCDECSTAPLRQVAADLWIERIGLNRKPACRLPAKYTYRRHILLLSPKPHFTFPRRIEGRVDLGDWLQTKMVYPPADGHPSKY